MHHFFVNPEQVGDGRILIIGSDVNHGKNVLRLREGEQICVSDKTGQDYVCEVELLENDRIQARILKREEESRELPAWVTLYQGLPKGDKMELIIQKAVELGAAQIVPVATKYAVVKLDKKREEGKRKRWQAIAESAAKQSKRSRIPEIGPVMTMKEALESAGDFQVKLFAYESQDGMDGTKSQLSRVCPGQRIGIFIGPEGGFDPEEVRQAMEQGWIPISLGKRILRTETAGMALLAVLMMKLESGI